MTSEGPAFLLVEDNLHDVELILRSLRKVNLADRVTVVHDGAEALQLLFGSGEPGSERLPQKLNAIILDLKLPKVDGLDVLRRIRADASYGSIPVVVLTSSKEERDIAESYRCGANSYIVKPVGFDALGDAVRTLGRYWGTLNQPPP
jgi:two-component system, response regulator